MAFVAFTGSVGGGHAVQKAAAARFIPTGLELGGKDPAYVRADADLSFAVENLVDGSYFNSGLLQHPRTGLLGRLEDALRLARDVGERLLGRDRFRPLHVLELLLEIVGPHPQLADDLVHLVAEGVDLAAVVAQQREVEVAHPTHRATFAEPFTVAACRPLARPCAARAVAAPHGRRATGASQCTGNVLTAAPHAPLRTQRPKKAPGTEK
jgi:hypothetical protein